MERHIQDNSVINIILPDSVGECAIGDGFKFGGDREPLRYGASRHVYGLYAALRQRHGCFTLRLPRIHHWNKQYIIIQLQLWSFYIHPELVALKRLRSFKRSETWWLGFGVIICSKSCLIKDYCCCHYFLRITAHKNKKKTISQSGRTVFKFYAY